jgi:hypothetical protein
MKRRGMRNIFSDEDVELMLAIRREAEARATKTARRSSRPKGPDQSQAIKTIPDPETTDDERHRSSE